MKNRMLSLLLALCMVFSLLPLSALAAEPMPFRDVQPGAWYYDDVQYVYDKGLMSGTGADTFEPETITSRAMLVTILHRVEKKPTAARSSFSDVPAGKWYTEAVDWAAANGIVNGVSSTRFAPEETLTREQFAAILYRYAKYAGMDVSAAADLTGYSDANAISDYAKTAMAWANAAGLITGVSKTELSPQGSATRAQCAAILARFSRMRQSPAESNTPTQTIAPTTMPNATPTPTPTAVAETAALTIDQIDGTVTVPKQTFTGTFTVEAGQIDRVDWVQRCASDTYDGTTGTAMIDQTKGTWEAADILLAPEENTITFTAYTRSGETVQKTVKITYDSGTIADYDADEITYTDDNGNGYVNDVIVVMLDIDATEAEAEAAIQAVCSAVGGELIGQLNGCALYQIQVPKGDAQALEALCKTAEDTSDLVLSAFVDHVYPSPETPVLTGTLEDGTTVTPDASVLSVPDRDPVYPNDTWDNSLWNTDAPEAVWDMDDPQGSNWWVEAIRAPGAWAYSEYFSKIRIGVNDSGLSTTHEDLVITKTLGSTNVFGHHGTHVAGLLGATANNGKGVTGVVWNKEIYGYDLFGNSSGTSDSTMMSGIQKLVENGCKVVNMSVGMSFDDPSELAASSYTTSYTNLITNTLKNYDFLVFQSAGNGFSYRSSGTDYSAYGFDATYNGGFCAVTNASAKEHIVVVAAAQQPKYSTDTEHPNDYHLTGWSCFGNQVTLASPGKFVYSTVYYDSESSDLDGYVKNTNGYVDMSGTSMASPIAAGVGALVWSVNPNFKAKEVKEILVNTAGVCYRNENNTTQQSMKSGRNTYYYGLDSRETYPMVNAEAAVEEALRRTYGDGTASFIVRDAENNEPLSNITLTVTYQDANGQTVNAGTITTDTNGKATLTLARANGTNPVQTTYIVTASGSRVTTVEQTFTIDVEQTTAVNLALAVDHSVAVGTYRIVLTWGAEPADLDAHLVSADQSKHVYYQNLTAEGARMDLDDTRSYGPETITVEALETFGGFTFYVHNFTDRAEFSDAAGLAASGATVRLYHGSKLEATFTVPQNQLGTVWNVFTIDSDGVVTANDEFAYSGTSASIGGANAQALSVEGTPTFHKQ